MRYLQPFFVDHSSRVSTYIDPRLPSEPRRSEAVLGNRTQTPDAPATPSGAPATASAASATGASGDTTTQTRVRHCVLKSSLLLRSALLQYRFV